MRLPLLTGLLTAALLTAGMACAQDAAAPPPPVAPSPATTKPLAGGVMASDKTVAQNIAGARDLADFTAAMVTANQDVTLGGAGPFTVFASNRGGFDRLPSGDLSRWMKSDKRKLTAVVTYAIVPELLTDEVLSARIKAGKGEAYLATVEGGNITVRGGGHSFTLTDVNGTRARVMGSAPSSNGAVYLVDNVLQP